MRFVQRDRPLLPRRESPFRYGCRIGAVSRVVCVCLLLVSGLFPSYDPSLEGMYPQWLRPFMPWDVQWFESIAQRGYYK
ncbi:hypothetical protein KIPB_015996, partial [Kipferlia bialata]|eukprot:g15996.t1